MALHKNKEPRAGFWSFNDSRSIDAFTQFQFRTFQPFQLKFLLNLHKNYSVRLKNVSSWLFHTVDYLTTQKKGETYLLPKEPWNKYTHKKKHCFIAIDTQSHNEWTVIEEKIHHHGNKNEKKKFSSRTMALSEEFFLLKNLVSSEWRKIV